MNDVIVLALAEEAPNLFKHYKNVFAIGVGKVNAAINVSKIIAEHRPNRIINFGTAGGMNLEHGIYRVNTVREHDFNCAALGILPGHHIDGTVHEIKLLGQGHICASGDLFVTQPDKLRIECDMVDMEAYSVVKASLIHNIQVEVWKYISDQADSSAPTDWTEKVSKGEPYYFETIKLLGINLIEK